MFFGSTISKWTKIEIICLYLFIIAAKYKTIKKLIMKQLNSKTIDGYIGVFKKHTEKFCASITGENIIDIRNEVVYLALRSTSGNL